MGFGCSLMGGNHLAVHVGERTREYCTCWKVDASTFRSEMSEQLLGPFSVTPDQISSLGGAFTAFVNELLRCEVATAGLSGSSISTSYVENVGDAGVDAGIERGVETRFVPSGASAWQFKRGDLAPAKCKTELEGASEALEILRSGGKYRLVLGVELTFAKKKRRLEALRAQAETLGISLEEDSIDILTASDLAEWAQHHPSLTIAHMLGGIWNDVENFSDWAGSMGVSTSWVESPARAAVAGEVHATIETVGSPPLHIEGVSGLGKSRTVLEALRGHAYECQVVYVRTAEVFPPQLIRRLATEGRAAILVVDECDATKHKVLAEALPAGSLLRLVTIGEPGPSRSEQAPLVLPKMERDKLVEILQKNRPGLWYEAAHYVAAMSDGNVRLALILADAVQHNPDTIAGHLITRDIIQAFVADALPEGASFLACCVLALLTRIGVSGEFRSEIDVLAEALGIDETELRASQRALQNLNLIDVKGRFRSVTPQPLAVYLAAQAWEDFEDKIRTRLIPNLDQGLLERLMQRAAEVGPIPSVLRASDGLINETHSFGSLEALENGNHIFELAVLADINPTRVAELVHDHIVAAADGELSERNSVRQGLVWILEKLARQSATFEPATDGLLRLAAMEVDTIATTATRPWLALFGPFLPATAASPQQRLAFLKSLQTTADAPIKQLMVQAGATMLQVRESLFISVGSPVGVLPEPSGGPAVTVGDVWDYQRGGIALVRGLADDADPAVATSAVDVLVNAIHPHLENESIRSELFNAIKSLPGQALNRARVQALHLQALFEGRPEASERLSALSVLISQLPQPTKFEEFQVLLRSRPWDFPAGELQKRITAMAHAVADEFGAPALLEFMNEELHAAFEFGYALAEVTPSIQTLEAIATVAGFDNPDVLIGYLRKVQDSGDETVCDQFLGSEIGGQLDPRLVLQVTVRGPESSAATDRAKSLAATLKVEIAARILMARPTIFDATQLVEVLENWLPRIVDQSDYNAAVDYAANAVRQELVPAGSPIQELIEQLVILRNEYPAMGQQSYDWTELAHCQIDRPLKIVSQMLTLMADRAIHIFGQGSEQELLAEAIGRAGLVAWEEILAVLDAGAWWIRRDFAGWLPEALDPVELMGWVGDDVTRARRVADLADPGGECPSAIVRSILDKFGTDEEVSNALLRNLNESSWGLRDSERIEQQIVQLQGWIDSPTESHGLKRWAAGAIRRLKELQRSARERDAESDF